MADPVLPDYVQDKIDLRTFSRQRPPGTRRADFESGGRQQIRIARRVLIAETLSADLSKADYALFLTWYQNSIERVGWFDYTPPGAAAATKARLVNGQITEEVPLDTAGNQWRLKLSVEYWSG